MKIRHFLLLALTMRTCVNARSYRPILFNINTILFNIKRLAYSYSHGIWLQSRLGQKKKKRKKKEERIRRYKIHISEISNEISLNFIRKL